VGSTAYQMDIVSLLGHGFACLGFLGLFIFLFRRTRGGDAGWMLLVSVAFSALWAATAASYPFLGANAPVWLSFTETLRGASWIGFLVMLIMQGWRIANSMKFSLVIAVLLGFVFTGQLLYDAILLGTSEVNDLLRMPGATAMFLLSRLLVAVGGLLLVHNLYVNAASNERWGLRYLCIALGAIFAYDLNIYAITAIYGSVSPDLITARGTVNLLIIPLIGLASQRQRKWRIEMRMSRQVVFTTLSLVAIGGYFIAMAAGSYLLRAVGGDIGSLLQIIFVSVTLILLALLFFSGSVRSWTMVKISKHFFAYKYDYRAEWLRFIATVSGRHEDPEPLQQRIIRGLCDIIDSPGGSLWSRSTDSMYRLETRLNFRSFGKGFEPAGSGFVKYLSERGRIADFAELAQGTGDYDGAELPDWAGPETRSWLAVPLIHDGILQAFVVAEKPRAARTLDWEDFDLLKTAGQQAASYLAEQSLQKTLAENAEFEAFNRRFAFVMHDIKNIVSQISVLSKNAERHADNPDFRQDMILTLKDSVSKMHDLLARLKQQRNADQHHILTDLAALVGGVVNEKSRAYPQVVFSSTADRPVVVADQNRLEQVFHHLIQNAVDAGPGKAVRVEIVPAPDGVSEVVVHIIDQGCGMDEAFIRTELFKPFVSTKEDGMGIGAYEAREIIMAHHGALRVRSAVGTGSEFTVILPVKSYHEDVRQPDLISATKELATTL
jgi:putative PEP-CTERM system histidine kinase